MLTHRERLILLNLIPGIGSLTVRRLLDAFGTLDQLWQASEYALQQVEGVGPLLAQRIAQGRREERQLHEELALAKQEGLSLVTLEDVEYPASLRTIHDPPLVLSVRGALPATDEIAVAIVGSRRASRYGLEVAERLAYDLALRGVTVVSGLARGIDGAAHTGALSAQGRTVAVLGSGLCQVYPTEHASLARRMVEQGGAVISEYPLRMPPLPHNFPRRNRIVSGLSLGVVIVEAAQRSGALITCDCALEQGKTVFAVPGPITTPTSHGTHQLLRDGAKLVTCVEDILDELRLEPQPAISKAVNSSSQDATGCALADEEQRVLAHLDTRQPMDLDTLVVRTGLSSAVCASALLSLELKQQAKQLPGKQFVRR